MIAYMWIVWDRPAAPKYTRCHWVLLEDEYDEWRKSFDSWSESR
jgi:hypothetical protein